jgi:hypothetical protein
MTKRFFNQIFKQLIRGRIGSIKDIFYYKRWQTSLMVNKSSVTDRMPWINFRALDFLKGFLKPDHKVYEYGGGGSTLFFLDRVKLVVTVEHNPVWFDILNDHIESKNKEKWDGNLILPENGQIEIKSDIADPNHYASDDHNYANMNFKKYASHIDKFPAGYFDVILIDGRARPSCLKHALSKLSTNGLLVLDNAERDYYLTKTSSMFNNFKLLSDAFAPLPYIEGFTQTNIWKKSK